MIAKGQLGTSQALAYLRTLETQRSDAMNQLNYLYREAMQINRGIENEISRRLKFGAGTKLASDVGVTVLGFTPGGLAATTTVQLVYGGINYKVQTRVATDEAQAAASKQLVVGVAQNAADVGAEGAEFVSGKFGQAAAMYDGEARAMENTLKQANHSTATRVAENLRLDRKLGLKWENLAKSNNWRFTSVVLKSASVALACYSVYLSYEDFKTAVGD